MGTFILNTNEIVFKRQMLGKWRRTDCDTTVHVTEDQMHREIGKLVADGWRVSLHESRVDHTILGINLKRM